MTEQEARAAAQALVAADDTASGNDSVVLEEPLAVRSYGWVFGYQSKRLIETGDHRYAYAGNAPLLVVRDDGRVLVLGTAHPVEHYLANYEATGDPHRRLGRTVLLEGGSQPQRLEGIRALVRLAHLPAIRAAEMIDAALRGGPASVVLADEHEAMEFVARLTPLGFNARREPERE